MYIQPDGSYYKGNIKGNKANDNKGYFCSKKYEYSGSVKNNVFDGFGNEKSLYHKFEGQFKNNKKVNGVMKW